MEVGEVVPEIPTLFLQQVLLEHIGNVRAFTLSVLHSLRKPLG